MNTAFVLLKTPALAPAYPTTAVSRYSERLGPLLLQGVEFQWEVLLWVSAVLHMRLLYCATSGFLFVISFFNILGELFLISRGT